MSFVVSLDVRITPSFSHQKIKIRLIIVHTGVHDSLQSPLIQNPDAELIYPFHTSSLKLEVPVPMLIYPFDPRIHHPIFRILFDPDAVQSSFQIRILFDPDQTTVDADPITIFLFP